ncbi:MAG: PAS domain S-box protein [Anaerolineaceae bacterium]|nr:PAS domain S-box protein [Anaerolineaceae bacterium]
MSLSVSDFKEIVESSPYMVVLLEDETIRYINSFGAYLLGAEDTQATLDCSILDYVHPDDRQILRDGLCQLEEQHIETPVYLEVRLLPAVQSGRESVALRVKQVTIAGKLMYSLTGSDITGNLVTRRQLQSIRRKFAALFTQSPTGILIVHHVSSLIINCNPVAGRLIGKSHEELLGKNFDLLLPPMGGDTSRYNPTQPVHTETVEIVSPDGKITPLALTISYAVWNGHNAVAIVMLFDMSDRVAVATAQREQAAIIRAAEKEREIYELRNRFMAMVSHEFRTPLATIQTSVDLLENYYDRMAQERRAAGFSTIRGQIRYLADMLDDISIMIEAESGRLYFEPVLLDVVSFCQSLIDEIHREMRTEHEIKLVTIGEFSDMSLDPVLLRYILRNLLTNAIKYSPDATEVLLELTHITAGKIIFRVEDYGIGIPAAEQEKLFTPYARGSNIGQTRGVGIGLQIVWNATHLHGGEIGFTSEEGKGTVFKVSLPDSLGTSA